MKKTVRIRKAKEGETPGYLNKTKQFLQKAEMGMAVGGSGQQQQMFQQMYTSAYNSLMSDTPADVVYYNLINDYGADENTSQLVIQAAFKQLTEEGYINPETVGEEQQEDPEQPEQMGPNGEEMAEQQEEEQLMMSEEDDSHITDYAAEDSFDEQQMQQQAFKYGGYFNEGGYAQQDPRLNQYDGGNNGNNQKPFSLEDLIQQQAGVQLINPQSSMISDYLPDYNPVSNGWENQNWLSEGEMPQELPKAQVGKFIKDIKKGYDWYNKVPQIQKSSFGSLGSGLGKLLPINTAVGYGLSKVPYWKGKTLIKGPKLESYFTQNIDGLQKVLNQNSLSAEEKAVAYRGQFSKNTDTGDLSVDRLTMPSKAIQDILVKGNTEGRSSFTLEDVIPVGQETIGGIYPANSKISLGGDDAGNTFFDISHTYKPGDQGAYFGIPSDATKTSFRNRFYYKPNEAGTFDVFDAFGTPLESAVNNMFQVTRPIVPSLYKSIIGSNKPDIKTSGLLRSLISRKEFTSIPPNSFGQLNAGHQFGRGLEQLAVNYYGNPWVPIASAFGYNPVRTRAKHIKDMSEPILSKKKPLTTGMPLDDVTTAQDIHNYTNYFKRKGRNAILGAGLIGGGLTYALWPNGENEVEPYGNKIDYIPRDNKFKGFNIPNEDILDPGIDYNMMNTLDYDTIQKKEGGTISKKKFTKNLLAFYEEGGENPNDPNAIGKGNRMDNAARDVQKKKDGYIGNLKAGSDKAITGEIYELAKGDPEIMQTLMTNGKQENLAEPTESNPNEMEYAQEGRELQNNGNQMEEIIGQVQGALESGAQPEEVMIQLLQGGLEPEAVAQIFVQLGMPEEQVVQVIQQVMAQGQQQPQGQPQGMGPSEEEMMAMQQQQQQMGPPPMMQVGGFADMDAENPLTRFISGGMESEYYDPYDMPQAHEGHQVQQCPQGQEWSEEHGRCITSTYKNINYTQGPPRSTGLFPRLGRRNKYMQMSNFTGNTAGPVSRVDFKNNWLGRPKKGTVYFGEGNFGENPNTGGGNTGGVYDNITNAFGNVASNMSNRKNNKYEKYLGEGNFGEDYWEDFRDGAREGFPNSSAFGTGEYAYNADSMRDMVVGKKSQNQLNKLYKSEDKQRFQDARQTERQTRRTDRRADRRAAQDMRRNQEYGGYIPSYMDGGVSPLDVDQSGAFGNPSVEATGLNPYGMYPDAMTQDEYIQDEDENGNYIPNVGQGSADFNMKNFQRDPEAGVNLFNAGARGVANIFENAGNNKREYNNMLDNTSVENNYASTDSQNRGNYVSTFNPGMFRPDQTGQINSGMASTMAKYGRYMEDGGYMQDENVPPGYHMMPNGMIMPDNQMEQGGTNSPYYDEGQEVFMTQDQLNNYLASGGQVEYLY